MLQPDRPAPPLATAQLRWTMPLFVVASLAAHAGVLIGLSGDPQPAPSIGIPAISVEIILGADTPAGVAALPAQFESEASAPDTQTDDAKRGGFALAARPDAAEPAKLEADVIPPEPSGARAPLETEAVRPKPESIPAEAPPRPSEAADAPVENEPLPQSPSPHKPAKSAPPKPKAEDRPRAKAASRQAAASASGVGLGRSSADPSYAARVAAHLARHKRFPPLALSQGARGTAVVAFSIDAGGRVTSVRLTRGTGTPSLDEEAQAMVRRASPLPAPPSGRAASMTLPVTFEVR